MSQTIAPSGAVGVDVRRRALLAAAVALILAAPTSILAQPGQPALGLKHTVAVDAFGAAELTQGATASDSLTAMLTDALISDGRFIVVERAGLGAVQTEQALGQQGAAASPTAAKTNQLIGASLLVRGAVTKFNANAGGGGVQLGGMFGLGGGGKANKATMTVSLRLIDSTSGQVLAIATGEGGATSEQASAGMADRRMGGNTVGVDAFRATPLGKAAEDAIRMAVGKLARALANVPWSAMVVDARGGVVYINAGADQNVPMGLKLGVYRKGEIMTDPATGAVLDVAMTKIGTIQVDGVREKISTAHVTNGDTPVRGDLLKVE